MTSCSFAGWAVFLCTPDRQAQTIDKRGASATFEWQHLGLRGPTSTQSHQASPPLQPLTHFLCHVWPSPPSAPQRTPQRPNSRWGSCLWLPVQVNQRFEATAAPQARKGLFLLWALISDLQSIQNASGSRASQRKTSARTGTKAELLPRQRRARSRPRGASFGCVALLSTCTKAGGPRELILLDTWPLILGPRPL